MKKYFFIAIAALALTTTSCKKDDPAPTDPAHVGLWKGKYGSGTSYPTSGYTILLRNNGTMRAFDGADTATASKAEGTYSISGSTLNATYTYTGSSSAIAITATMDKNVFMEGSWGTAPATTTGKFFVVKQ